MASQVEAAKARVLEAVDRLDADLRSLALRIHAHPEVSGQEFQAQRWLTEPLIEAGFEVELGIGGLPTAFRAVWRGTADGPVIGLLAEYDALPGVGHACGHNLIGTAAVGAALALRTALPDLPGRIEVIGCPMEEKGQGKVHLDRHGVFDHLDVAMLCHPGRRTMVVRGALSAVPVTFKFYGQPTHAAVSPEKGVSALDACIQAFNAINALRQMMPDGARIHGIITHGGEAVNVIPAYAEARFSIRAETTAGVQALKEKVYRAVRGAAESVGARVEIEEGFTYPERVNNLALAGLFGANLESLGVEIQPPITTGIGSSDIAVVTHKTATIHPYIKIADEEVGSHSPEFRDAAGSETGLRGMRLAASALAMTAVDLCYDPERLRRVRSEFRAFKAGQTAPPGRAPQEQC